jgi:hypothetical protein
MNDTSMNHLEIPKEWGWCYLKAHFAQILHPMLEHELPQTNLTLLEMVAYHQGQDDLLLLCLDHPDRFLVVKLSWTRKKRNGGKHRPVVFDGPFSEFAAKEQKRYAIKRRMIEEPNHVPGICPVCFVTISDQVLSGGIWTGGVGSKASNGPLHSTTCKNCHSMLIAMPTREDSEAGVFVWGFEEWGDEAV